MRDVGEEVVYFESEHSDEEEARHALNTECTPLIDPWYDIHAHFPKVPDDYTSSLSGRVWLALCRHNRDVSWASLASSIPYFVIHQDTSLLMPILFEFGLGITLGWKEWVDRELSDTGFMGLLQWASEIGRAHV